MGLNFWTVIIPNVWFQTGCLQILKTFSQNKLQVLASWQAHWGLHATLRVPCKSTTMTRGEMNLEYRGHQWLSFPPATQLPGSRSKDARGPTRDTQGSGVLTVRLPSSRELCLLLSASQLPLCPSASVGVGLLQLSASAILGTPQVCPCPGALACFPGSLGPSFSYSKFKIFFEVF